jgi:hypothetical protein
MCNRKFEAYYRQPHVAAIHDARSRRAQGVARKLLVAVAALTVANKPV